MNSLEALLSLSVGEKQNQGLTFTPREIFQQPSSWEKTFQTATRSSSEIGSFLRAAGLDQKSSNTPTVFLVGAGTSDYAGRAIGPLLRRRWRCECHAIPSTDLLTNAQDLVLHGQPYLWISFSRSGDSPEGVAALKLALGRYPEIRHLIVTCNKDGRMAQKLARDPRVCCLVLDDETNDRGLAMTSSFSSMVVAGQCLAYLNDLSEYETVLKKAVIAARSFLPVAADLSAELARTGFCRVCFLGTGALKAVAQESSLKVLELTAGKICPFSESFLGVRHGPLSGIDDQTLVVGFLSGDASRRAYELDMLVEIREKNLGKKTVLIVPSEDDCPGNVADIVIPLGIKDKVPDDCRPPLDVIFGQLLGLFTSIQFGLKPDTPSPDGVISRVVGRIKIYR